MVDDGRGGIVAVFLDAAVTSTAHVKIERIIAHDIRVWQTGYVCSRENLSPISTQRLHFEVPWLYLCGSRQ